MKKGMIKQLIGLVCIGLAFSASATTWTYNSADSTITDANGQWTIIVGKNFKTTKTLTMSQRLVSSAWKSAISGWQEPGDPALSGVLDLRSPLIVKDGADGTETTIQSVEVGQSALGGTGAVTYSMTELYCDIIGSMGATCFGSNKSLKKAEIGGTADNIPTLFAYCTNLKTIKFNFPDVRKAGSTNGSSIFGANVTPDTIDVATVVTSGITNILKGAFMSSKLYGDIVLTNIMSIGAQAFQGAMLTNVYLAGTLTELPDQVFRGNSTITNVVLDLPNLTTIAYQAFGHPNAGLNQTKIRRVEFVSAIKEMGLVTNIVRYANNSNIGDLRIYVSKKQWTPSDEQKYDAETKPTGFFSEITDKEKAALDAETQKNIIGVLVKGGTRKGIFIHKASIYDKKQGFAISIR